MEHAQAAHKTTVLTTINIKETDTKMNMHKELVFVWTDYLYCQAHKKIECVGGEGYSPFVKKERSPHQKTTFLLLK